MLEILFDYIFFGDFCFLGEHLTPRMLRDEVNPLSQEKNPEKLGALSSLQSAPRLSETADY